MEWFNIQGMARIVRLLFAMEICKLRVFYAKMTVKPSGYVYDLSLDPKIMVATAVMDQRSSTPRHVKAHRYGSIMYSGTAKSSGQPKSFVRRQASASVMELRGAHCKCAKVSVNLGAS
jgi:hypothetical protein